MCARLKEGKELLLDVARECAKSFSLSSPAIAATPLLEVKVVEVVTCACAVDDVALLVLVRRSPVAEGSTVVWEDSRNTMRPVISPLELSTMSFR